MDSIEKTREEQIQFAAERLFQGVRDKHPGLTAEFASTLRAAQKGHPDAKAVLATMHKLAKDHQ